MKKPILIVILCVLAVLAVVVCVAVVEANTVVTGGEFDLEEYQLCTDLMPENTERGAIPDAEAAAREAAEIWREVYGKSFRGKVAVKYDGEAGCWLVSGQLSLASVLDFPFFPNVIITEDGVVLSMWLEQL